MAEMANGHRAASAKLYETLKTAGTAKRKLEAKHGKLI
jgi:hypothetical protein